MSRRTADRIAWAVVAAAFVASRVLYRIVLGLELDATTLTEFWQYLDVEVLAADPLFSLFYQHTQPPLFGAILAAALQTPDPPLALGALLVACGAVLHLALYGLARALGVRRAIAVPLALLWALNPAPHLYETWVFYTYPVAALLMAGAWVLHRGLERRSARWIGGALLLLAAVCLMRSLFHLVWLGLVVGALLALVRNRRGVALAAVLPLLLAASVYVKNGLLFDRPVASTWLGMSLSRLTTVHAPPEVKRRLLAEGRVTPLVRTLPWLALGYYPAAYRELPAGLPDHPVLTARRRSGGRPNLNHGAYLRIADDFLADARVLMREHPETYRYQSWLAWNFYVLPCHDYSFFARRRPPIRPIEQVYEAAMGWCGQTAWTFGTELPPLPERGCWRWLRLCLLVLAVALLAGLWRRRDPRGQTVLYLVGTVAFVAAVGNQLEVGENNRFRFLTEAYVWVLFAFVLELGLRLGGRAVAVIGAASARARRGPGRSAGAVGPPAGRAAPAGRRP